MMHLRPPGGVGSADDFRVFKTLMSLLRNRGYEVEEQLISITKDRFDREYVNLEGRAEPKQLAMQFIRNGNEEDKIAVEWVQGAKVGVKPIREFGEFLDGHEFKRGIVIVEKAISPFGKQALAMMRPIVVECFTYADLKFDITTHKLVPKHRLLSPAEKQALLTERNLRENQLPRLLATDPVARYFGLERGQVVEITRESETIGTYTTYRIVLPA